MSTPPQIIDPDWNRYGWSVEGEYEPPPETIEADEDEMPVPAAAGRPKGVHWWAHVLVAIALWNVALYVKQPVLVWILVIYGFMQFGQGAVGIFRLP